MDWIGEEEKVSLAERVWWKKKSRIDKLKQNSPLKKIDGVVNEKAIAASGKNVVRGEKVQAKRAR